MKRLSKAILLGGGGLAALAVIVLTALNLYLRSRSAQVQIEEAIADAIDLPVRFESTSLSLFGDLKIHGVQIAQIDGSPGNILEAQSFTADYRLLPLLGKKLVVPHMTIDSPKLVWRQDAEGEWSWPSLKKMAKDSQPKVKVPKGVTETKPKQKKLVGKAKSGFQIEIADVAMRNGTIDLVDLAGEQLMLHTISIRKTKDDADSARVAIGEIRSKIVAGARFEDFARVHHDDSPKDETGDGAWVTRKDLDEDLVKIAFGIKPGQVSPVVELRKVLYLLLAGERKGAEGVPLLTASGVDIDLDEFAPPDFTGRLRAQKVTWSRLACEQVSTPFTYEDGALDITDLNAQLGGGTAHGTFKLETEERGRPHATKLTLSKVELAKLMAALGQEEGFVSGQVSGDFELHGTMKKFAKSEGSGQLRLEGGHFQKLELFETIGQVLGIEELTNLQFNDATVQLRMADEKIFFEPMLLATPDLKVTAKGSMRLDSRLNLDARLAVNDAIAKRLPGFVRDNFTPGDNDPLKGIDFKVTGTADSPKTDIAEKLIGKKVGEQIGDLLGGLFGTKKGKKDDADDPPKEPKEKKKKKDKGEKPGEGAPAESEADKPESAKPEPARPADAPVSKIEQAAPAKPPAPEPAKEPAPQS